MGRGGVGEVVCTDPVSKDFPLTFAKSCTCLFLAFKVWVKVLKLRKALKNQVLKISDLMARPNFCNSEKNAQEEWERSRE